MDGLFLSESDAKHTLNYLKYYILSDMMEGGGNVNNVVKPFL